MIGVRRTLEAWILWGMLLLAWHTPTSAGSSGSSADVDYYYCLADVSAAGLLFYPEPTPGNVLPNYVPGGPCFLDSAFGRCVTESGVTLYEYCSSACRDEVDQVVSLVNSTCLAILKSSPGTRTVFDRCEGSGEDGSDCGPTASGGGGGDSPPDDPPAGGNDSSSGVTAGGACAGDLAEQGLLYKEEGREDGIITYTPTGSCAADGASGTCSSRTTGEVFYRWCSDGCRDEIAQVNASCAAILSLDDETFASILTNCQGSGRSNGDDCGVDEDDTPEPAATPRPNQGTRRPVGAPVIPRSSSRPSPRPSPQPSPRSSPRPSARSSATPGRPTARSSRRPTRRPSSRPTSRPVLRPAADGPPTSGASEGGACAADLADLGALYEAVSSTGNITEYQPSGPCTLNGAFGTCVNNLTNEVLFDFCSDACRADLAQANATCRAVLSDSIYFAAVLRRCDGNGEDGADCGSGARAASVPTLRPTRPDASMEEAPAEAPLSDADGSAVATDQHGKINARTGMLPGAMLGVIVALHLLGGAAA